MSIALDSAGHIIVADCCNNRVQVLRYSDGSHVRTIGSKGSGNGQFQYPCSVAVDGSGNIFVHDGVGNGRIQVFRVSDGAHVRSMCSKGSGPGRSSALAVLQSIGKAMLQLLTAAMIACRLCGAAMGRTCAL